MSDSVAESTVIFSSFGCQREYSGIGLFTYPMTRTKNADPLVISPVGEEEGEGHDDAGEVGPVEPKVLRLTYGETLELPLDRSVG